MTKGIIAVRPISGNKEDEEKKESGSKNNNRSTSFECISYQSSAYRFVKSSNARLMIERLLTQERIVLVPIKVANFTVLELAKELKIEPFELERLYKSAWYCKKIMGQINLRLVKLYCSTKFYDPTEPMQ